MIIVDTALKARAEAGKPIRVGILGSGFMAQGLTNQIVNSVPGMTVVAMYARKLERAIGIFEYSGLSRPREVTRADELEDAIRAGKPAVTGDAFLLSACSQIDVLVDTTGSVEFVELESVPLDSSLSSDWTP